jgi:hypothetical protein
MSIKKRLRRILSILILIVMAMPFETQGQSARPDTARLIPGSPVDLSRRLLRASDAPALYARLCKPTPPSVSAGPAQRASAYAPRPRAGAVYRQQSTVGSSGSWWQSLGASLLGGLVGSYMSTHVTDARGMHIFTGAFAGGLGVVLAERKAGRLPSRGRVLTGLVIGGGAGAGISLLVGNKDIVPVLEVSFTPPSPPPAP